MALEILAASEKLLYRRSRKASQRAKHLWKNRAKFFLH